MWWLCLINVARKSHTHPTNGLLANAASAGGQDGKHLQVKGLNPVSVGAVGVLSQPNLAHLLAHRGPIQVAQLGQLGQRSPARITPLQLDHCRVNLCCRVIKACTADQNSRTGLKVTLPRVKILQMLDSTEQRHMSAEDVYKALMEAGEDVGLATVYRVLTQFEAAGLVVRHNFDGGHAVFELADGGHHDHMVNVDTSEVIEFMDAEIEKRQREIVAEHGYELVDHNLVLYVRKKK